MARVELTAAAPKSLLSVAFDSDLSEGLERLAEAMRYKVPRSAARAGALVFYDEMKLRAPVATGLLRDSIYHWHDDSASDSGRQVYVVGPNVVKAPHWYLVEYGHWRTNAIVNGRYTPFLLAVPVWTPAHSYIRATWDSKLDEAGRRMRSRAAERLEEVLTGRH